MTRKIITTIVGIALIALSMYWTVTTIAGKEVRKKQAKPASVKYAKTKVIKYQDYTAIVEATGRLNSFNKTSILSEVQGRAIFPSKRLKVGNRYSKGEIIMSVDSRQAVIDLKSAKSAFLSLISSSMADIKLDYPDEFPNWQNYLKVYSIEEPINDLPEVTNKQLKYFLSNRNIFKTFYDIKNLELRLDKHTIEAPFSCVVINSNMNEGGLVVLGQVLATIAEVGTYELELAVNATEADLVFIGSEVRLSRKSGQNKWKGQVVRKAGNIDPNSQTQKVFANITGTGLMDGMYFEAQILGKKLENVFKIDRSALVNNESLYYLDSNKELQITSVEILLTNDEEAYIRGIEEFTTVVAQQLANVAVGTKIEAINPQIDKDSKKVDSLDSNSTSDKTSQEAM